MKTIRSYCLLVLLSLLVGCQSHPTTVAVNTNEDQTISGSVTSQVSDHVNVGVQGSGNPTTGEWTAGVVITFKAAPDQTTAWALEAADAVATRGGAPYQYVIPKADWGNPEFRQAMQLALKAGATITAAR